MAVKERSQIKGTDAQIKAFAGHNGVLAFATDTKSLHVLSGTAGTTTEFLPSSKFATVATSGSYNDLSDKPSVDSALSSTSENPVQNKVINSAINSKLDIKKPTADELLLNYGQGGWLTLLGKDFNREDKGGFILGTTGPTLAGNPDGSLTWGGKPVLCGESGGFPVGFIALYSGNNVPNGWFRCDGSTIADMATNYPKLYAVLGTNVLPNYSGRVPLGAIGGINDVVAPGLPDIQGTLHGRDGVGIFNSCTGAFGSNETTSYLFSTYIDKEGQTGIHKTTFKASNSSSIYGASTTVTPPSIKTNFIIKHD